MLVKVVNLTKYVKLSLVIFYLTLGKKIHCVIVRCQFITFEELNSSLVKLKNSYFVDELEALY